MSYVDEHEPGLKTAGTKIWDVAFAGQGPCLGQWLIFAPWAHPVWQYHILSLIHLRDVEGESPAGSRTSLGCTAISG